MNRYAFSAKELLKYRQVPAPVFGEEYLITAATMLNRTGLRYKDYAMVAAAAENGLQALLFDEETLRPRTTDRDLYWRLCDEGEDKVSLLAPSVGQYLNLTGQGAFLSDQKQALTLRANGTVFRFSATDETGTERYLRCVPCDGAPFGYVFTASTETNATCFALLRRERGLSVKPEGKPILTVGSVSDIHIDYNLQAKAPYIRKSVRQAAVRYRRRFDLDILITCGDNTSDNASYPALNRGALQGKWPRAKFLQVQRLLQKALRHSFRDESKSDRILWLSGNHDSQLGDHQPEGQCFNSADFSEYLPKGITHRLTRPAPMDVGVQEELLCYEYRVGQVPFLVLNTPLCPIDHKLPFFPHRPSPGHDLEQAEWLAERLKQIEEEQGRNAPIFVLSHYPFHRGTFLCNSTVCSHNLDAYLALDKTLNRYPNLYWCYGHVHGTDDWITHRYSGEMTISHAPVEMAVENGAIVGPDSPDRGNLRSDLAIGVGFKSVFVGSLAFFETSYFKNDGKKFNSGLTELEVPFSQGMVFELYDDRIVLTMQNLGTEKGTALIQNGVYRPSPVVFPLD